MIDAGFRPKSPGCGCRRLIWLIEPLSYAFLILLLCYLWWAGLTEGCGPACWGEVSGMRFIYLHLHINLCWQETGIMLEFVISLLFRVSCEYNIGYLHGLIYENVNFYCEDLMCVCVADRKRGNLPLNWYDVWHLIYCSWPVRLITLPKAIKAGHIGTEYTHARARMSACTHTCT